MEPRRLWNDDTLSEIFSHLTPTSFPYSHSHDDRAGVQALARCARSSRTLHGVALEALWRDLDSLLPLVNLLLQPDRRADGTNAYTLDTEVSPAAKERFRFYAKFVRTLSHNANHYRRRVYSGVLADLKCHFPDEYLLPGLVMAHCSQSKYSNPLDLTLLVSPSLRRLSIAHIGDQPDSMSADGGPIANYVFGRFIRHLSTAAPSLQDLSLSGSIHPSSAFFVSELTQLQKLKIVNHAAYGPAGGPGAAHVLHSCAALDHLLDFGINLTDAGDAAPPPPPAGFKRLRDLTVHGTLALVASFLRGVSSPQLSTFSAYISRPDRIASYAACARDLAARFGGSLRAVHISGPWLLGPAARPMAALAPLLALRALEEFWIVSGTAVALSLGAEDVGAIARAWPAMRDLRIVYQAVPATLPITALAAFGEHCPALRALWLAGVDFRGAAALPVEERARGHGLRKIALVGDVAAGDALAIAKHVESVFPRVDTRPLECEWEPSWHSAVGWDGVLAQIQKIRAERK